MQTVGITIALVLSLPVGGGVSMETPEQRATRYRERARKIRASAEHATSPTIKKQMLVIADRYDEVAIQALDPQVVIHLPSTRHRQG
jgi:hypothetical protein